MEGPQGTTAESKTSLASSAWTCCCTYLYLRDHGWRAEQYDLWTRPGSNGEDNFTLNMRLSWHHLKEELSCAQARERTQSIQQRTMLQDVQQPLDWQPWRKMLKQTNTGTKTALQTWHEGAIFTKTSEGQEGKHQQCPHCKQPATAIHLLWLCKETSIFHRCLLKSTRH